MAIKLSSISANIESISSSSSHPNPNAAPCRDCVVDEGEVEEVGEGGGVGGGVGEGVGEGEGE